MKTKTDPVGDEYFGVKISDHYRYLENLQDTAVLNWLKQQSDNARSILNKWKHLIRPEDEVYDFYLTEKLKTGIE